MGPQSSNQPIQPQALFSPEILDYQVVTKFRGTRAYINLDSAATTPPLLAVERAVNEFITTYGSVHRGAGTKSKLSTTAYERSRHEIKKFVNAPSDSYLIFSGNTTGAMNAAAHFFSHLKGKIAVSSIEHSSSWLPWIISEGTRSHGTDQVDISELKAYNERILHSGMSQVLKYKVSENCEFDLASIEELLKGNHIKALVLTASSNLNGYAPDIKAIGELVHQYGGLFIVDACQYIQHHEIDMQALGIDFLAASGHKFYAPYGGGFLIGPKTFFDRFLPYQMGGGNIPYITKEGRVVRYQNETAHDPGTPNAVGAISMAAALTEISRIGFSRIRAHEIRLARNAYEALERNDRVQLHVSSDLLGTVIPFSILGMNHREVAERLNGDFGIGLRAGSFCVYDAIRQMLNIEDESEIVSKVEAGDTSTIPGVLRASFSLCNHQGDVEALIDAINEITAN